MSALTPATRRRPKLLRCIPAAETLRRTIAQLETEAAQLRELLIVAEKIDAAGMANGNPEPPEAVSHG